MLKEMTPYRGLGSSSERVLLSSIERGVILGFPNIPADRGYKFQKVGVFGVLKHGCDVLPPVMKALEALIVRDVVKGAGKPGTL